MSINKLKVIVSGVLFVVMVVAILIDPENTAWAVTIMGGIVIYIIGNAQVTSRTGNTAPIISNQTP